MVYERAIELCVCASPSAKWGTCLKVMTVRNNVTEVPCTLVDSHAVVEIIVNKVFPLGISEEDSLVITLYKVVKL